MRPAPGRKPGVRAPSSHRPVRTPIGRGWTEIEFIEDAGYSAKSIAKRPGLEIALAALQRGDAGVLVVSKMDRLSRSLLDFAGIMQTAQREGWALLALDSPADLTTPTGEAMAGVLAVFAQLERRLIGERTRLRWQSAARPA